ncbi:type III polyketide synthase [Streptomyces sp. KR80]|uniref:type III polyketide synthase n=1 Tax=Streptomyces sp. KR80 TaxID=3457426 RepID=UPI003FD49E2B
MPFLQKVVAHSGIARRHLAVSPAMEDVTQWSTGTRMRRYAQEALPLSKDAVVSALDPTGVDPADVGLLCLVSSTGYAAPGVDTRLARDIGMSSDVERLSVGHMGCFAALPALAACANFVRCHQRPAVMLNAELSSLHLQPPPWDNGQLVVNSLFGDAMTAAVIQPGTNGSGAGPGLDVLAIAARTDTEHEDYMSWNVGDHGFRMGLSPQVPEVLADHLPAMTRDLLSPYGIEFADVRWWAVHPGGPGIVDAVEQCLGLSRADVAISRQVLRDHGNCASAGLVLVMDALQNSTPLEPGQFGVGMAFGPGLTLYTALLRGA